MHPVTPMSTAHYRPKTTQRFGETANRALEDYRVIPAKFDDTHEFLMPAPGIFFHHPLLNQRPGLEHPKAYVLHHAYEEAYDELSAQIKSYKPYDPMSAPLRILQGINLMLAARIHAQRFPWTKKVKPYEAVRINQAKHNYEPNERTEMIDDWVTQAMRQFNYAKTISEGTFEWGLPAQLEWVPHLITNRSAVLSHYAAAAELGESTPGVIKTMIKRLHQDPIIQASRFYQSILCHNISVAYLQNHQPELSEKWKAQAETFNPVFKGLDPVFAYVIA